MGHPALVHPPMAWQRGGMGGGKEGIAGRILRLLVAVGLIPVFAWVSYFVARGIDGNPEVIDNNGSGLGAIILVTGVFAVSRVASDDEWTERAGVSLALSAAFFLLTWVRYGDNSASVDSSPHVVWYGVSVLIYTPAVVLSAASRWAWDSIRVRRETLYGSSHN